MQNRLHSPWTEPSSASPGGHCDVLTRTLCSILSRTYEMPSSKMKKSQVGFVKPFVINCNDLVILIMFVRKKINLRFFYLKRLPRPSPRTSSSVEPLATSRPLSLPTVHPTHTVPSSPHQCAANKLTAFRVGCRAQHGAAMPPVTVLGKCESHMTTVRNMN